MTLEGSWKPSASKVAVISSTRSICAEVSASSVDRDSACSVSAERGDAGAEDEGSIVVGEPTIAEIQRREEAPMDAHYYKTLTVSTITDKQT